MTGHAFDPRIKAWNQTATPRDPSTSIPDLLWTSATRHPAQDAIVENTLGVTYRYDEYSDRTRRFAGFLASQLGHAPQRVAYLGSRSAAAIVALSGIMAAGYSYVPIDPSWPRKRQLFVLKTLKIGCVVHDDENTRLASELAQASPDLRMLVNAGGAQAAEPQRTAIAALWDDVAEHEDLATASGFNQRDGSFVDASQVDIYAQHVCRLINDLGPSKHVLEIGCGPGLIMRQLLAAGHRCAGLDPSGRALNTLHTWAQANGYAPDLNIGFADQLPDMGMGKFDVILLSSCLQFFPSYAYLDQVLAYLPEVLTPGGHVVLADLVRPDETGSDAHLSLERPLLEAMLASHPGLTLHHASDRKDLGLAPPIGARWDATLVLSEPSGAATDRTVAYGLNQWLAHEPLTTHLAKPDGEAYVIFTSGTTGVPKGVGVSHRAVVNLIEWAKEGYRLPDPMDLLFVTSLGFDLSVFDMFGTLSLGGTVHVAQHNQPFEPELLARHFAETPVTVWDSAPAVLASLIPFLKTCQIAHRERPLLVMLSGDWIPLGLPAEIRGIFPNAQVLALGGATEATVWSNQFHVDKVEPSWPSIPYGTPMANARYYVLDDAQRPCPVGTEGDLFIAGTCVADGYVTDPKLTQQKFMHDPWHDGPDARMYATGDRAVWQESGWLEFRGRLDDQVKISGFRIELGEIAAALSDLPNVRDAFVCALGDGENRHLAACVLTDDELEASQLRQELAQRWPTQMIPARIEGMTTFPLSATGKTDRAALLDLLKRPPAGAKDAAGPGHSPFATIWEDLLGRRLASEDENFFQVGGHSLLAAQLPMRVRAALGVELELREVFLHPVFSELNALIEDRRNQGSPR